MAYVGDYEAIVGDAAKSEVAYTNVNDKLCAEGESTCDNGRVCFSSRDRCDGVQHCHDNTDEYHCAPVGTPGFQTVGEKSPPLAIWEMSAIVILSIVGLVLLFLLIRYSYACIYKADDSGYNNITTDNMPRHVDVLKAGRKRWFTVTGEQPTGERFVYRYDPETGRGSVDVVTDSREGTPTQKRQDDLSMGSGHSVNSETKPVGIERHSSMIETVRSVFDRDRISPSLNNLSSQLHHKCDLADGSRPRSSSDSATRFVYRYNPATGKGSVEEVPVSKSSSKNKCNCSSAGLDKTPNGHSPPVPKFITGFSVPKHPKTHHLLLQPNSKRAHKYTPTKGRGSVELIPSSLSEGPPRISLSQCDLHHIQKQDAKGYKKSSPVKPKYIYRYNPSTGRGSVEMIPSGSGGVMPATSRSHGALHTVLEAPKCVGAPIRRPAHMGAKYVYKYNPNSGRGSVEIIPKGGEAFGGRRRNHHFNYQSSPLASPQGQGPSYSQHLSTKGHNSPGTPKQGTKPEMYRSDKDSDSSEGKGISLSISNLLDDLDESQPEIVLSPVPRPRLHTIGSCPSSLRRGTIQTTAEVHYQSSTTESPVQETKDLFHMKPPEERRHSSYDRLTISDKENLGQVNDLRSLKPASQNVLLS